MNQFPRPPNPPYQSTRSPVGLPDAGEPKFVRNSLLLIATELTSKLLGLILFVLMARLLGANDLGLYAFSIALANFFAIAPKFGFEKRVAKEVGRDGSLLYSYFREINAVKAILSLCSLGLLWLLLQLADIADSPIVMLIACFVFIFTFLEFTNALFRGIGKPEYEVLARSIFSLLNLSLGAAVLYAGWGLRGVVTTQLISVSAALIIGFMVVVRLAVKTRFSWHWRTLKRHVTATLPFAAMLVTLYFGNQVSIVIVQAMTSRQDVGYFAAALRLFESIALIPAAIMGAFLPMMSRLYKTSVGRFLRTLRFTLKYLFVISAPIAVGAIIVAPQLIELLYGEEFAPAEPALQVLMIALIFSFWNNALTSVLIARNQERLLTWLLAGGAVFHVGANIIFILILSFVGAGWAIFATRLGLFVCYFVFLRRYLNTVTFMRLITPTILCTAIMGTAVYLIRNWNIGIVILVGAIIYTAAVLLTGTARMGDLDSLKSMIGVKQVD